MQAQGDLGIVEKKVEATLSYLGFRVQGQGDLVSGFIMRVTGVMIWLNPPSGVYSSRFRVEGVRTEANPKL